LRRVCGGYEIIRGEVGGVGKIVQHSVGLPGRKEGSANKISSEFADEKR